MAPASIAPPKLLTVPDAADRLCVSHRKLWRLIATGALKSVRVGVRGTRVPESALTAFVASLPSAR
jgi:excisionase family DNA binding protein